MFECLKLPARTEKYHTRCPGKERQFFSLAGKVEMLFSPQILSPLLCCWNGHIDQMELVTSCNCALSLPQP